MNAPTPHFSIGGKLPGDLPVGDQLLTGSLQLGQHNMHSGNMNMHGCPALAARQHIEANEQLPPWSCREAGLQLLFLLELCSDECNAPADELPCCLCNLPRQVKAPAKVMSATHDPSMLGLARLLTPRVVTRCDTLLFLSGDYLVPGVCSFSTALSHSQAGDHDSHFCWHRHLC